MTNVGTCTVAAAGYAVVAAAAADEVDIETCAAACAAAAALDMDEDDVGRPAMAAWMSAWIAVISGAPEEEVVGVVRDAFCEVTAGGWDCA